MSGGATLSSPGALIALRRALHGAPDLAGSEHRTASMVRDFLNQHPPDAWIEGIGGTGFVALYEGAAPGPRVLFRAELDALPIPESIDLAHGSDRPGVAHKCGHDGHMAMVAGLAPELSRTRPARGSVALLFQPAEETGEGAERVVEDPLYAKVAPDRVFALHNLPGHPLGSVIVRPGPFASASTGLIVELTGATSHASEPESGNSPALAVASLIQSFSAVPQRFTSLHEAAQVTIVHAKVGEVAFGTSPGAGVVMATLRSHQQDVMDRISERCLALARGTAETFGLQCRTRWTEPFPATHNDPESVDLVVEAALALGLSVIHRDVPFPWSEDFGRFTQRHPGALFGLGAGEHQPPLHHPTYDFPDEVLNVGTRVFLALLRGMLGPS
jgi:amidohydrolase